MEGDDVLLAAEIKLILQERRDAITGDLKAHQKGALKFIRNGVPEDRDQFLRDEGLALERILKRIEADEARMRK